MFKQLTMIAFMMVFSVSSYYVVSNYIVTAVMVQGRSMVPTLQDGDRYYLNRWILLFRQPKRGDLVVIRDNGHTDFAVKRIIVLPCESLRLEDGRVYIDGQRLSEPYLLPETRTLAPNVKSLLLQVGKNQYYVMGDNREVSEDSRSYGPIKRSQIVGVLEK
jgi:signal peptidase I